MGEVFEIRTAAQLRVFNAPATRAVFEGMLDLPAGGVAAEIGARAGLSAESTHYHLKKLVGIGLVREVGVRDTGARPGRVFGLVSRRVELRRGRRGAAYVREVVRGVRLMLRLAEREYEIGADASMGFETRPRVVRNVGWLSADDVKELDRLEVEMHAVFERAERRAHAEGRSGRERVAVTVVLSPIERVWGLGGE